MTTCDDDDVSVVWNILPAELQWEVLPDMTPTELQEFDRLLNELPTHKLKFDMGNLMTDLNDKARRHAFQVGSESGFDQAIRMMTPPTDWQKQRERFKEQLGNQ